MQSGAFSSIRCNTGSVNNWKSPLTVCGFRDEFVQFSTQSPKHLLDHSDSAELVVTGQMTCIGDGIGDTAMARLGHDQLPLLDLGEAYTVQPYGGVAMSIKLWTIK